MSPRKILHAADIHLDSPLQKLDRYEGAPAERIRSASRQALQNLTRLAIDQRVDLVVIAGDLYDGDWTDQNTGLAFVAEASRLVREGIPVLVIRGNHDAANQMTSSLPLPKNPDGGDLLLAMDQPETRLFESLGIAVHGQSFRNRAETINLVEHYPEPLSGLFNLGLLHTGLEGNSKHAHYAPCSPSELTDKGYDYWALGHIHTRGDHGLSGGPPIVFSGNLQGRHIGESGEKGCVLVEINDRNECHHTFMPLDVLRWYECQIDVSEMTHVEEVFDAYQRWLAEQIHSCQGRLLVTRVRLLGRSMLYQSLHRDVEHTRAELQAVGVATGSGAVWLEDLRVSVKPPVRHSVAAELEGPLESLSHVLNQLRADSEASTSIQTELKPLYKKLPKELTGDPNNAAFRFEDPEWVSDLIESAAANVLGRFQGPEN